MSDQNSGNENPPASNTPLGGRTGAIIAAIMPFIALVPFLIFGFAGGWTWSWVFFLLVPITGIIVYGPGTRRRE